MGATRYKFEGKEIQLCNGSTELPKFVDDIFDFWSHVDPEPLDKGQCINAVADKLFDLLTHYYRDQVKFASKKKRNNAPQIKFLKHFKIWMYAILFCGHAQRTPTHCQHLKCFLGLRKWINSIIALIMNSKCRSVIKKLLNHLLINHSIKIVITLKHKGDFGVLNKKRLKFLTSCHGVIIIIIASIIN